MKRGWQELLTARHRQEPSPSASLAQGYSMIGTTDGLPLAKRGSGRSTKRNLTMSKDASSYSTSRYNALKHGCCTKGPIACRGEDCLYRQDCPLGRRGGRLPVGHACPLEAFQALEYEQSFRHQYGWAEAHMETGTFDALVKEAVEIDLLRLRASTRANRAWLVDGGITSDVGNREFCLAYRYSQALGERYLRVMQQIDEAAERAEYAAKRRKAMNGPVGSLIDGGVWDDPRL
jgi:hypothetical protein